MNPLATALAPVQSRHFSLLAVLGGRELFKKGTFGGGGLGEGNYLKGIRHIWCPVMEERNGLRPLIESDIPIHSF